LYYRRDEPKPDQIYTIHETKVLMCYLIHQLERPLTQELLRNVMVHGGIVDYFIFHDALQALVDAGNLIEETDGPDDNNKIYSLTDYGVQTAEELKDSILWQVKEKAIRITNEIFDKMRRDSQEEISCEKTDDGYMVRCVIHDIGSDLMDLKLYVPDKATADKIRFGFDGRTTDLYRMIINQLTGN